MFKTKNYFKIVSKIFCVMENKKYFTTSVFMLKPFSRIKMDLFFKSFIVLVFRVSGTH